MSVLAVIVTYNSDLQKLKTIFNIVCIDADIIVSDNSTEQNTRERIQELCEIHSVKYISMGGNVGIAKAQNDGIKLGLNMGYEDILLLDDDSLPHPTMISSLLIVRGFVTENIKCLPVICANPCDAKGNSLAKYDKKLFDFIYNCRDVTSSGTLINKSHFDLVGLHDEKLFIDCVDFEWGWRAISKGVQIVLSQKAILTHQLGTGRLNIINAGYGAPIRHYYQFRNVLNMCIREYTPFPWKISQIFKLGIKYFILIPFFFDNKVLRLKYATRGVLSFIRGKYGPIN
ncbi:glycosyltransferase [Escherichia coli]|uniref:glycosyltransferase n=1 Tax=Escherichia TaxID=561 RepID=UPI0002058070|nr:MULTISPECIES: glycosyltransferase [Escherichia]EET0017257.1 glycosyltransferase [Escherichia coli]EEU0346404.1 glycosyltransferase [Escherichia coli]EEU9532885.1 glycosyltransferase [Escherichia coli]EEV0321342.1 glycosyltransferase [Escherichia coli]EEV3999669.1 glycosyltransferase [Escherichia coli]